MVDVVSDASQSATSAQSKGLNIQLDAAANDSKSALAENPASPRLGPSDWDALKNKAAILKDLSKLQKELEMLARLENKKVNQSYPLPGRLRSVSQSIPSSSPPSSRTSMHYRRRSLISDDDSYYDESSTLFESDIDCNTSLSTDLDPSEVPKQPESSLELLEVSVTEVTSHKSEPDFWQGLVLIEEGFEKMISATLSSLSAHPHAVLIVVSSSLILVVANSFIL